MSNSLLQYWDSDVIIHAIQRTPEHLAMLDPLISEAENGNLQILLSAFSLMEVYKDLDGENVTSKEDDELIIAFFENPYFIIKDLTEPIALHARQISRETGIKPKDAVHVATALYHNVPVMFSFDGDLIKKAKKLNNSNFEICEPVWKGQPELIGMSAEQIEDEETARSVSVITDSLEISDEDEGNQVERADKKENNTIQETAIAVEKSNSINKQEK